MRLFDLSSCEASQQHRLLSLHCDLCLDRSAENSDNELSNNRGVAGLFGATCCFRRWRCLNLFLYWCQDSLNSITSLKLFVAEHRPDVVPEQLSRFLASLMRLERKEQRARIAVTVWECLMESLQSSPADALSGFPFFHTIGHQVFHGAGVYRFRFSQFC